MATRYAIQNDATREYLTYTPSVGPMPGMPVEIGYDASTDPLGVHFLGASWGMMTHAEFERMGMEQDGSGYTVVPIRIWMTSDDERAAKVLAPDEHEGPRAVTE